MAGGNLCPFLFLTLEKTWSMPKSQTFVGLFRSKVFEEWIQQYD